MYARAGLRGPSEQATFRKADAPGARHDEVVKHPNIDELQSILQPSGDQLVRRARLCNTRGVVVCQQARGGIMPQGFLHHFARMDARAIDRATEEILALDDSMPAIEVDHAEDFVRQCRKAKDQIVPGRSGRRERSTPAHPMRHADAGGRDNFIGRRLAHGTEVMIVNEKRIERAHERAPS